MMFTPCADDFRGPASSDYRWSARRQRAFLEQLADTGSVTLAARSVGVSVRSAYVLRRRRDGLLFALGWVGAVLLARHRLTDILLEWAIEGVEEVRVTTSDGEGRRESRSRRRNGRIGLDLLSRLDRMAQPVPGGPIDDAMTARLVAQDFETFLDQICPAEPDRQSDGDAGASDRDDGDADAGAAFDGDALRAAQLAVAAHLIAAAPQAGSLGALWQHTPLHCELASKTAALPPVPDADHHAPMPPEAKAQAMSVWRDAGSDTYRTDFPPPAGFTGWQSGHFGGDAPYARALSPSELSVIAARQAAVQDELVDQGATMRDAWFGDGGHGPGVAPLPLIRATPPVPDRASDHDCDGDGDGDGNHGLCEEPLDDLVARLRTRLTEIEGNKEQARERAFCTKYGVAMISEWDGDAVSDASAISGKDSA